MYKMLTNRSLGSGGRNFLPDQKALKTQAFLAKTVVKVPQLKKNSNINKRGNTVLRAQFQQFLDRSPSSIDESSIKGILDIRFDNDADPECTVLHIDAGPNNIFLMAINQAINELGLLVHAAEVKEGKDKFLIKTKDNKKVPDDLFEPIKQKIESTTVSFKSSYPTTLNESQAQKVRRESSTMQDKTQVSQMRKYAQEIAKYANQLELYDRGLKGEEKDIKIKEVFACLERNVQAFESIMQKRKHEDDEQIDIEEKYLNLEPAAGSGFEIVLQGFHWNSCDQDWYEVLRSQIKEIKEAGVSMVWLPPPQKSVSKQGYLPSDYYDLDSHYGSETQLRSLIKDFKEQGISCLADVVINHRCAGKQDEQGRWNVYTCKKGLLEWNADQICKDSMEMFGGRGQNDTGDGYEVAPNIDHLDPKVQEGLTNYMKWLIEDVGYEGFRFDYVKGYGGTILKQYIEATKAKYCVGEYWDACNYTDGVLQYNQDDHRQKIIDWIDIAGGSAIAFDFTTKGILQEALYRNELWRLSDPKAKPPGVMGWWPSRTCTFIENHDTGSTQQHWPFPHDRVQEGYAYILTHPGNPCVFYDHFFMGEHKDSVRKLVSIRRNNGINCKSKVKILRAQEDLYAALIDNKIAMKIGNGNWSPRSEDLGKEFEKLGSGNKWAVWKAK